MPELTSVSGGVIRGAGATGGTSSVATTITASNSADTKGTAVELTSATEFDANWMLVQVTNISEIGTPFLVDILIGAATESVLIPDLYGHARNSNGNFGPYLFPVFVPKGSRLAARCQYSSTGAGHTVDINVVLVAGTALTSGSSAPVTAYGAVASSLGTNVDPGATKNTDSAWTEITSGTTRQHNWWVIAGRFGDGGIGFQQYWRMAIGIGAATEQTLVPDLHFSSETAADYPQGPVVCLPLSIPAGSRLTARARCSENVDSDRDIYLKLYGV